MLIGGVAVAGFAQSNRITSRIDNGRRVTLRGRVHPMANAANDAGAVESSFPLFVTLLLKPSADQQSGLDRLIVQQQNPSSATFHQWLTPEQYGDRFGASAADAGQITAWLQAQGFTVDQVARSRTFITFSGTSSQVQNAFGTAIHRYRVNGETHYANSSDPQIPAALTGLVAGIRGLNDFHPKSHLKRATLPQYNTGAGKHQLAPDDFAAIYNLTPMYAAGINGTGQSIAIVGQADINTADTTFFWNKFGLTSAKLVKKLVGKSPVNVQGQGDVDESNLDIQWASAVARNATIVFYYSDNVWTSALYAVEDNATTVLSMSYGNCEMFDLADLPADRLLVQKANAQGITWLAAAGDTGASDCDYGNAVASGGLAIDTPAAIPEVTAMGGTQFNEAGGSYWNGSNSSTFGSAKGYIPEVAWNESAISGDLLATGGGASVFFPQPAWQTTGGVPNDGMRHVPDISFNSSVYHGAYYVYSGGVQYFGGTSAATPTMAGVVALLNQYLLSNSNVSKAGLGNINPILYRLAQISQAAPSELKAFHDVTDGNNNGPCAYGSPDCNNGTQGWPAGPGYDSATGLGSVNVTNLIQQWSTQLPVGSLAVPLVVPSIDSNPVFQVTNANGKQWPFLLTLTEEAGIAATLTDFTIDGTSYAGQIASLFGSPAIVARGSISASYSLSLGSVPKNVTFGFSGVDANGAPWSTALTVPFTGPQTHLSVAGVSNAATGKLVFAPGMVMSVYGTGLGTLAQAAGAIPLPDYMAGFEAFINNVPTPLYYVSPNQVNLQIPYETANGTATLSVGNPYETVDFNFQVAAAGPGVFMFPDGSVNPSRTARAGDTVPMFITGEGRVTPSLATGTAPAAGTPYANLPRPRQTVTVTVGGLPATTTFVGIPSGLVGVTQINFTIPASLPSGPQPVVVTVGTTQAPAATITIQ